MKIQKNSRQVPKNTAIITQKYYSDILYGYLQVNSLRDQISGERYIEKKQVKYTDLATALGISRQTISKKFNKLIDLGLVYYVSDSKRYVLPPLKPTDGFLIPKETLRIMTNTLNDNTINVYIYLINRFFANKEQSYDFTLQALKKFCGLGTESDTNNYIITDILQVLQKLGLIKYKTTKHKNGSGKIKTYHHLISASLTCC